MSGMRPHTSQKGASMNFGYFRRKRKQQAKEQKGLVSSGGLVVPAIGSYAVTGATGPALATYLPSFSSMTAVSYPISTLSDPTPVVAPPELQDLGTAIEPIVALRSYYVDLDTFMEPRLCSFNGTPWPPRRPLYAHCGCDAFINHEVPFEDCQCGIYAWRQELTGSVSGNLYGEVYLWGDVLICDQGGYRAEIAYPKSLFIASTPTRSTERIRVGLAEAYGIPVEIVDPGTPFDASVFGRSNPELTS